MGFSVMLRGAEKLVPVEYWCPYGLGGDPEGGGGDGGDPPPLEFFWGRPPPPPRFLIAWKISIHNICILNTMKVIQSV